MAKSNAELAVRLSAGSLIASEERTSRHRQCVLDDAGNSPDRFAYLSSRPDPHRIGLPGGRELDWRRPLCRAICVQTFEDRRIANRRDALIARLG